MSTETSMISKIRYGVPNRVRRIMRSPFQSSERSQIVHCAYHKMGTKWFTSILAAVADHYGLSLQFIDNNIDELETNNDVLIFNHSDLLSQDMESCVGSHMLRDLRDVVVSGYFYHLWTDEPWAHVPCSEYGNQSYQQHINSLDQEQGIRAEIEHLAAYVADRKLTEWNYDNHQFLELKYENVFGNEEQAFRALFEHYGFTPKAIDVSLQIARNFSFKSIVGKQQHQKKKSHLRSGKSGQWQDVFSNEHRDLFKEVLGQALIVTGYEKNLDW